MSMFGNLGQLAGMMKDMQGMKKKMEEMKNGLAMQEFSAVSANGQVTAVVSGEMILKRLRIQPAFAACGDTALIEDTVTETVNSAIVNAKMDAARQLSEITGGMDLSALGLN